MPDLRAWDAAIESWLGIECGADNRAPGAHLVGYHASAAAPIAQMLREVPVTSSDVLVDLGAGLGKVALLARLWTGARVRGIELQASLVTRARDAAARVGLDVDFVCDDARAAALDDGTVFFMYAPFTGPVLREVLARLENVARTRRITVCTLGIDVDREAPWLVRRASDAFWLAIYDSGLVSRSASLRSGFD